MKGVCVVLGGGGCHAHNVNAGTIHHPVWHYILGEGAEQVLRSLRPQLRVGQDEAADRAVARGDGVHVETQRVEGLLGDGHVTQIELDEVPVEAPGADGDDQALHVDNVEGLGVAQADRVELVAVAFPLVQAKVDVCRGQAARVDHVVDVLPLQVADARPPDGHRLAAVQHVVQQRVGVVAVGHVGFRHAALAGDRHHLERFRFVGVVARLNNDHPPLVVVRVAAVFHAAAPQGAASPRLLEEILL